MKIGLKSILVASALIASTWISGCSTGEATEYSLNALNFTVEGPVYEGSETAQVEVSLPDEFQGKVSSAALKSIRIKGVDSSGLSGISAISMSMMGDKSDLTTMAVLNPLPEGENEVVLTIGEEANPTAYFEEGKFYILLDLTLNRDFEQGVKLTADASFDIIKK